MYFTASYYITVKDRILRYQRNKTKLFVQNTKSYIKNDCINTKNIKNKMMINGTKAIGKVEKHIQNDENYIVNIDTQVPRK